MGGGGTAQGRGVVARAALNRLIARVQPGARLRVTTSSGERSLAVEHHGPPEWAAGGAGCVLTLSDGREAYVLRAYPDSGSRRPWLYGPRGRLRGRPVVDVRVEAAGEPVTAAATAADLFPRVARYGGR